MAIDNRLQVFNEEGQSVDYDILASDVKFLPDGKDLPTKLAELEQEIEDAGSGDGTVTGVKVGSTTYEPTEGVVDISQGIPDVSGKANKSEMSVVPGTGANADKTTITLKEGTNATVLTQHQDISGKVDKETGKVLIPSTDLAKLQSLPTATELTTQLGQKANDNAVVKTVTINGETKQPQNGNVSFNVQAGGESVVINSDGADIVDSHTNPSILVAPSARQMYMAAQNIDTLFRKVNDLYDKLAGIAFTEGKPANWKEYANWLTPAIPTHTITLGTMTNVDASIGGTSINGSTSATEGEVTILLAPTSNNYMGSISVKDASNNDVAFTQTDVVGGTEITFILSGNVTINASASSGIEVNVSGTGITSYTTGVRPNTAAQLTIALPEHHTWGTVTVSYGGTDITSQCTISQASNADKVITLPNNLSDMSKSISIVANTVEDAHVTIAISGSNFVVKQGNSQLSNGSKIYNGSAAQTLTIEPASGYKFSTLPSADQGTMTNNGPYEASSLEIGTSVSGTLTITAAGAALDTFSIDLSGLVGVTSSNPATSILEGSPYSTTLSKTDASAAGSVIVGTCTMGNENIAPQSGTTINVAHVTDNIVLAATVGVQPSLIHSYDMDIQEDGNGKRYIPDKVENQFPLYNGEDAGLDAGSNLTYPSGYYGNSSYSLNRNGALVKYGNPVLGLSKGDDFTIVMKDLFVYPKSQNINPAATIGNNGQQVSVRFHAERQITSGVNNSEEGQFNLSVQRNAASGAIGKGDYVQLRINLWTNSGSYFGTTGRFPCDRALISGTDTYTHTYHLAMSFVASTSKATAYLIDIDNQAGTVTVTNGGEITISVNEENKLLDLKAIVLKPMNEIGGLDIYNYAVAENAFSTLYALND